MSPSYSAAQDFFFALELEALFGVLMFAVAVAIMWRSRHNAARACRYTIACCTVAILCIAAQLVLG